MIYLVEYTNCPILYCSRECLFEGEKNSPLDIRDMPDGSRLVDEQEVRAFIGSFESLNKCFRCSGPIINLSAA